MRLFMLTVLAGVFGTAFIAGGDQDDKDKALHVVLPKDAIPAISDPKFDPASRAERVMADDELVIGLVGKTEQRAYSTWQLDRHEIVNDVFEGRPVAVTW